MPRRQKSEPVVPKSLIDRDGDAANNGTGFGKPAKDLSHQLRAGALSRLSHRLSLKMKPGERQVVAGPQRLGNHLSQSRGDCSNGRRSRSASSPSTGFRSIYNGSRGKSRAVGGSHRRAAGRPGGIHGRRVRRSERARYW
jgi:hypothetical protein